MPHSFPTVAADLMKCFAQRSGIVGDRRPDRYLWTDAFAVCNFLALWRQSGDAGYRELALRLVAQVHGVLGKHREDDPRRGWLGGRSDDEAAEHPTRGGLRIGKRLSERARSEPADERIEWDQDGQYFHYLTRWMHALDLLAQVIGDAAPNRWACELATTAHRAFVYRSTPEAAPRMFWKMSIDLSRPLVASMGHHDPLDGLITCWELRRSAARLGSDAADALEAAIADFRAMCAGRDWATTDPLGLGGLLDDIARVVCLHDAALPEADDLLVDMLRDAQRGVQHFPWRELRDLPAYQRLGFRELGLSIGLRAIDQLRSSSAPALPALRPVSQQRLASLVEYSTRATDVENFWIEPEHQQARTWTEHRNINEVMLATSLLSVVDVHDQVVHDQTASAPRAKNGL